MLRHNSYRFGVMIDLEDELGIAIRDGEDRTKLLFFIINLKKLFIE